MTNCFTSSTLFGQLFSDAEIADRFTASSIQAHMLAFEAAWTDGLNHVGYVSSDAATAAQHVIHTFAGADLGAGSECDGLPVPALVAALRHGQPDAVARAIHTGATSQDVIDTAMVLTYLSVVDVLAGRVKTIVLHLDRLIDQHGADPLMARTRMQQALPATAALRLDAWRRPLVGHLEKLVLVRNELAFVQVGGAVGLRDAPDGHGDAIAAHVAKTLGLSVGPVWHTDRSKMVGFGHWLTLVTGSLGKIGQDIALMAQQGIQEITLSGGGTSSVMAHKQNPIAAEAIVALARSVAGQQATLGQAMIHEQERSGTAWALEWLTLPAMAEATGAALRHMDDLLASVERIGTPH